MPENIRVAHVNVARGYRGGERQTELLVRGLAEQDVEQVLVARRGESLASRLATLGGLEIRPVSGNPLSVALATGGVDLVHVHEGRSIYGAWLRRSFAGMPYLVTRRVDNPIGAHRLARRAWRAAACVVALTPQVAEVVHGFNGDIATRVIHSSSSGLAVDPVEVERIRSRYPGKTLVGHVGALDDSHKGQRMILAAARALAEARPEVMFLLVGNGRDEAILKQEAAGLRNVAFVGFVDNVGDYLAAFDVFVFPSRREGLGSILLDAMERGLPIVATRVGGIPEVVADGRNGLLVDSDAPEALHAALLRLLDSPELRSELGAGGRRAAARFTATVMCAKYLALYREILGR